MYMLFNPFSLIVLLAFFDWTTSSFIYSQWDPLDSSTYLIQNNLVIAKCKESSSIKKKTHVVKDKGGDFEDIVVPTDKTFLTCAVFYLDGSPKQGYGSAVLTSTEQLWSVYLRIGQDKIVGETIDGDFINYSQFAFSFSEGTCLAVEAIERKRGVVENVIHEEDFSKVSVHDVDVNKNLDRRRAVTTYKQADILIDVDYEYYVLYNEDITAVEERVKQVINGVNTQYQNEVGITHNIKTIVVRTNANDPYTSTGASGLLNELKNYWDGRPERDTHDIIHLFTGRNVDGSTIGIAYLSAVCVYYKKYGVDQVDFNGQLNSATDLIAHELGHNWGADHCAGGCPSNTMNPSITSSNTFSSASITTIINYRNEVNCLDDIALCDNDGVCSEGENCFNCPNDCGCSNGSQNCNEVSNTCEDICNNDSQCDLALGESCSNCPNDCVCDDNLYCNGAETCSQDTCSPGTAPCSGDQTCDEATDTCVDIPICNNNNQCDGSETCSNCPNDCGCAVGSQTCNEITNSCENICNNDSQCDQDQGETCSNCPNDCVCDDQLYCNGAEVCSEDSCSPGNSPCSNLQTCDEATDTCVDIPICNNNNQCDGSETCSNCPNDCGCSIGSQTCNEVSDICEDICNNNSQCDLDRGETCSNCPNDCGCDDDLYCNGVEICSQDTCSPGTTPCSGDQTCDEATDTCVDIPICNNNNQCDGSETCSNCPNDCGCSLGSQFCNALSDICEDICNNDSQCDQDRGESCSNCPNDCVCDDDLYCNGVEVCSQDSCSPGTVPCSEDQTCDEAIDTCVDIPICNNNNQCDGSETCSNCPNDCGCSIGSQICNEVTNTCENICNNDSQCDLDRGESCSNCPNDCECDDGLYCNGVEICSQDSCSPGSSPCSNVQTCDEATSTCVDIPICNNNNQCDGLETCSNCPNDCGCTIGSQTCNLQTETCEDIANVECNFDGICTEGENKCTCRDCTNNNGVCQPELGENCFNSPEDCRGRNSGNRPFCCGAEIDNPFPVTNTCQNRCNKRGFKCGLDIPCDPNSDEPVTVCGNDVCELGEDCTSCPQDCPSYSRRPYKFCCGDGQRTRTERIYKLCGGNY